MREGSQLGVDAYGVSGFTRSCAPAIVYKAKQAENIMFLFVSRRTDAVSVNQSPATLVLHATAKAF